MYVRTQLVEFSCKIVIVFEICLKIIVCKITAMIVAHGYDST